MWANGTTANEPDTGKHGHDTDKKLNERRSYCRVRFDLNLSILTQGCLRLNDLSPFTVFNSFSPHILPCKRLCNLSK